MDDMEMDDLSDDPTEESYLSWNYPGYDDCLKAAGATVLAYSRFGSYQGDWMALISYNGSIGFVKGYYGSCGECDRLADRYVPHHEQVSIGLDYLSHIMNYEEALASASKDLDWDMDAEEMVRWVGAVATDHNL